MGLPRAERANIEAVALQRVKERWIVDLGIMRHRHERRVAIDIERRQPDVRPFGDERNAETLGVAKAVRGSMTVTS